MNNMYKRSWRKRRIKINNNVQPMQLKGNEKLLFFVNDNEWNIEEVERWLCKIAECLPYATLAVLPASMFKNVQKITGKEYSMLNNILKRYSGSNEVNNI